MAAPALSPQAATLTRAFDRATAERVVVYRLDSNDARRGRPWSMACGRTSHTA